MSRRFHLFAIFATSLCTTAFAEPRITEMVAAGQTSLKDEDNATPDWLEIHNPDATPVALGGWTLSDREGKLDKWTFPAVTVAPGGYLIVFASGKNRKPLTGRLHTNFGIGSSGGSLYLSRPNGTLAQTFAYPAQIPEIAWDGSKFLTNPTPGLPNSTVEEPITLAPEFSHPRGFHTTAFNLTMTSGSPDAAIYYTLDGSEPGVNSTRYTAPIRIAGTTVVRAVAFSAGNDASPFTARTFLFPADIVKQSPGGGAPKGWPKTWGENVVDYGMDPEITRRAPYSRTIKDDLRAVPTFSVAADLSDLFDANTGIYANPFNKGREWERPISLEYIEPTGGGGFQIQGGIRIRGGASRDSGNPKHSLQFRFRKEYGASHLDYPLLGEDGPARTDAFDLRWDHLVSWHYSDDPNAHQLQDIFGRDSQLAASGVAKKGHLTNLYINGQYWGLFFIDERVNGDYGANHFGGAPEDYDVIRYDAENGATGLNEGTRRVWRAAFDLGAAGFGSNERYFRALGRNPDGSRNPSYERLIDEENLIDYMLVGIWCGATDNPVVNGTDNNWTSIRSRKGDFGFRFFVHDFELSMFELDGNFIGENPSENELATRDSDSINPWHFWMSMRQNAEFRMKVADRVQKHFFNGGALTSEACVARWNARMQEMERAIVAESARWGDSRPRGGWGNPEPLNANEDEIIIVNPPPRPGDPENGSKPRRAYTRADWLEAATTKRDEYVALRSEKMLQHLKDGLLYPTIAAPQLSQFGGTLPIGGTVELTNPGGTGTILYTLNGPDPRVVGGGVHGEAKTAVGAITIARKTIIRARVLDGNTWSAMVEAEFIPGVDFGPLRITEIHYNPAVQGAETADDGEFIELQNTGTAALDLSGCSFAEGITYTFPANSTIAPGAYYVIARNASVFAQKHPGVTPNGIFTGKLGDDGESIVLTTAGGARIFALDFDDESPWPFAPDGFGPSLVYDGDGNPDDGRNWHASAAIGGSPAAAEPAASRFAKVVVNEVLGGSSTPYIELHNTGPAAADISNWRLGTDRALTAAKIFDAGTVIPAGGFLIIRPSDGMPTLDSAGGAVFLYSVPAGYAHECRYGPLEQGVASGRHVNGDGEQRFVAQSPTPGAANSAPLSRSALRISEVFFAWTGNPALDFIEIENSGAAAASLEGLRVIGLNFTFPAGISLPAGERLVVTRATEAAFRAAFENETVPVFGPTLGDLQDNGERVALEEPIAGSNPAAWRTLDEVRYNDRHPWPVSATGPGDALHRLPLAYGDESASWVAGIPTPGAKGVDGRPRVTLTSPQDQLVTATGGLLRLAADAVDVDGTVEKVEFFVDGRSVAEDAEAPFEAQWAAQPGTHDIVARATDELGNFGDSAPVVVFGKGNEAKDAGAGLKAEYFANAALEGTAVEQVAETIDFDWSELAPSVGVPRTGFSARFTGKLVARASGSHTLVFRRAGGLRVYLGGERIMDYWDEPELNPGETFLYADTSIELEAGLPVDFVVEYFDTNGHGNLSFSWYEPNDSNERPVPQGQLFLPAQDISAFGISTPSSIPTRRLGQRIKVALETARAEGEVVWRMVDGTLPTGVSLVPAGLLSGAANSGGEFTFRLEAEDGSGAKSQRKFRMRVVGPATGNRGPVVRISSPATGSVVGKVPVSVSGNVSGVTPLLALEYSLNNGARHPMPVSRNWSLLLDSLRGVVAGENKLKVFAIDEAGLEGTSSEISFRYRYRSELNVIVNGGGSVSSGYLGTTLRFVGSDIEVTAKPAPGWIFSHWEPSFDNSQTLRTKMEENLQITANFIENPFKPFAGRYTGLVGEGRRQGRYDLTISPNGRFTMSLFVGGSRQSLAGMISPRGDFNIYQDRDPKLPNATSISLRFDSGETVISTQYFNFDNFEVFDSVGVKSSWKANCPAAGLWTLSLESPGAEFPGTGYATMKVGRNGLARVLGRASNGWPISASLTMDDNLRLPFYTAVGETETVAGALNYISQRGLRISGNIRWVGENLDATKIAEASPYRIPRMGFAVIFLTSGQASFVDTNPALNFATPAMLNNANKFVFSSPGTALPAMTVSPKNGLVTGSYIHSESGRRVQVRGVVNQSKNSAAGITLDTQPGGFEIATE